MKTSHKISIALAIIAVSSASAFAVSTQSVDSMSYDTNRIIKGRVYHPEFDEKVVVGNDTTDLVIRDKNYGRYDRGLFNYLFIPKKQWAFGLMASYGEFDASDVQILQALKDLDFSGKQYAIRPSVAYFFKNNQCIGLKLDYTRQEADLGRLAVNLGDDLSFDIHDISYYSTNYSFGVFYRNYVGLGRSRRFAIFNEAALSFGSGTSRFRRPYNSTIRDTKTEYTDVALNFSPGLCVFIMDYISFNVSFGVFGLHLRNEKQITDGVDEGSRFSSGADFKFNLFNINFGIGVHI